MPELYISTSEALWFTPFVLPICYWVALTDLREMKITNKAVLTLTAVFLIIGLIALPSFADYGWRLVHLVVVLVIGIAFNAAGLIGAGDAKFAAAAAPFILLSDMPSLSLIFAANLLASFATHRMAKHSPLRRLAPDWKSWSSGNKFPMGISLGGTLAIYMVLGVVFGT
ncbi:Type IV prepilin peptidase TadV/CpaA [hydrothermal vent metagenome]|uniref:Type IV prepilin peptidase TadV/CpaA n=1 Tax=hydrothermal vent metagenome TaxID=652676 RepID=A0A3B0SI71_9ZZZZ